MKRIFVIVLLAALMVASFGSRTAHAGATTCNGTYTVVRGDYLSKIARYCGVTLSALINANPSLGNWNLIYPGQVLTIPDGTNTPTPQPNPGGTIYIVQPGDTLRIIANRFQVTIDAILKVNPGISNPNLIYVGQRITLPGGAAQVPTASISPVRGQPGSQVTLAVNGFRANIDVEILFGVSGSMQNIGSSKTDGSGALLQNVTVPSSAQAGKSYVFEVRSTQNNNERAVSNVFTVSGGTQPGGQVYIVQRGDTLRIIAARFGTTVNAILAVNPNITNPSLIYVGQRITIPGGSTPVTGAYVTISPTSGTPGSNITLTVGGFPANADVDIKLGLSDGTVKKIVDGKTDANGSLSRTLTIPNTAVAGEKWSVRVHTTEIRQGTTATSNTFTVK